MARRASLRRSAKRTKNTEEAAYGIAGRTRLCLDGGGSANGWMARMTPRVTIGEFFRAARVILRLELLDGRRGLARSVEIPRIQKPGLALAGYLPQIHPDRIQVLGNTEISYLATLPRAAARKAVRTLLHAGVACMIVTNGTRPPAYVCEEAVRARVPLLLSSLRSALLIRGVTEWLERRLAPQTQLHGALREVFHLGALILGPSGIGKSEAAL